MKTRVALVIFAIVMIAWQSMYVGIGLAGKGIAPLAWFYIVGNFASYIYVWWKQVS